MSRNSIAVAGFGKTGQALVDFLLDHPGCRQQYENIFLFNDNPITDQAKQNHYEKRGIRFLIGQSHFGQLREVETLVLSPGINGRSERFNHLRESGIQILSEIEFAYRFFKARVIGVTGTNGKSTTVSLIHHILKNNGINSLLLGNIGIPLIAEVKRISPAAVVVLELSSFQLEEIVDFRPHIALLLNITPDHLDRYDSIDDYFSAKLRLFKNQEHSDFMVLNHDDPRLRHRAGSFGKARETWFSLHCQETGPGAFVEGGHMVIDLGNQVKKISLQKNPLRGVHNLENLLASSMAASLIGIAPEGIEKSIADFKGLPHRMEILGRIGAVEFINDSKATNVDAALKSINSIDEPLVLILGGKDKGGDFTLLEDAIKKKVDQVLLVGKAADIIYDQLKSIKEKFLFVKDFSEAAARGYEYLKDRGGVMLLAPACASFDMFENFEQRGEAFRQEFLGLKERMSR